MDNDHVRIMCPALSCRKILAVPVSSRGKNVRCKNCGATIRVPDRATPAAPPPPPAGADKDKKGDAKQPAKAGAEA